jgi:hypothetical protein
MLTYQQAEAEARWRWGGLLSRGFVRYDPQARQPYQVGTKTFGKAIIRGEGTSWESAFGNAARKSNGTDEPGVK